MNNLISWPTRLLYAGFTLVYIGPLSTVIFWIAHAITNEKDISAYFFSTSFLTKIHNSLVFSGAVSFGSLIVGGWLAYLFYCQKFSWQRNVIFIILLSLFATSPIIYLSALTKISFFGRLSELWQSVVVLCLNMSPLAAMILILSLGTLEKSAIDNAFMTVRPKKVFRYIIFPQVKSAAIVTLLIIFMLTFIHEEVPSYLGFRTYAGEFLARIIAMTSYQDASIAALPFIILGGIILSIIGGFFRTIKNSKSISYDLSIMRLNFSSSTPVIKTNIGIILLFIICIVILLASQIDFTKIYILLIDNTKSIIHTFIISGVAALLGTCSGFLLHHHLRSRCRTWEITLWLTVMLFYWLTPSSLSGLALIRLVKTLNINSLIVDYTVLELGYLIKLLPISLLVTEAMLCIQKTDDVFFKFIQISHYNIFTKIIIPLNWVKFLVVYAILFIFAINEISASLLLIPPGVETVIIKIYNLMHYGDLSSVSFLSLVQVSMVVCVVLCIKLALMIYDKA